MLEPWAKQVEANAGGRVKIEIFPAMTLGGRPPELINQVRDGVVDLIWTLNGYTPGLFPRSEVLELPGVYTGDLKAANLALHDLWQAGDLAGDFRGMEVMFLHVHAGQGLQMRDRVLRKPADFAGVKLRGPNRTAVWMIEALGAAPVAMPLPDLPQALQKNVVDGAFIPWEIIPPYKFQDQTDYQIEGHGGWRFGTATFMVSMNKARWDSLPADIRKAFRDASGPDWWAKVAEIWRAAEDVGIKVATEAGNTHVVLTPEETTALEAAMAPVEKRWIEEVGKQGIDGAALVEKARAAVARHAAR
jgi:TRAP-type C4-dicarboxylate transport system substrate-binding protein